MKKWFKYILITVTIFFIGIVNAKAEDVTNITCTYKLPYTGLWINKNQPLELKNDPSSLYYTVQIVISNGELKSSNVNNYKNQTLPIDKIGYNDNNSSALITSIAHSNICPEYMVVASGRGKYVNTNSTTKNLFEESLKNNSGNTSLKYIPNDVWSDVDIKSSKKFIAPLYSTKVQKNATVTKEEISKSSISAYLDITLDAWYSFLKENESKLDSCTSSYGGTNADICNIAHQASLYLNSIGMDGGIRQYTNKTKFNYIYNLLNSKGYISDDLQKEISKDQDLNEKRSLLNDVENNKCLGYCNYDNSTSVNYCKSNNTKYSTCRSCYTNKCANKNGTELETCLSECLGQDEYNTLNNLAEQFKSKLSSQIEAVKNQLYKPNIPTLEGISFNQPYKVKCSDFSVLHTLWKIVIVAAPILTILFGVLDFAKSVISSDEEKIKKSWKRFPKRLMALAILIIVPILISIVVNSFTNNEGIKDTSVLKCIVNGE